MSTNSDANNVTQARRFALSAERSVAALCSTAWRHLKFVSEYLKGDDFADPLAAALFRAATELSDNGRIPDLVSLSMVLEDRSQLAQFGGPGNLEMFVGEAGAAPGNLPVYVEYVARSSARRKLAGRANDPTCDLDTIQRELTASLSRIKGVLPGTLSPLAQRMSACGVQLNLEDATEVEPAFLHPFWGIGDHIMLAGKKSSGKTTLAAHLILAAILREYAGRVAGGLLRFNLEALGDRKIAILDGENVVSRWQSMFVRLLNHAGLNTPENRAVIRDRVVYFTAAQLGMRNPSDWVTRSESLGPALAASGIGFYVLDSAGRFWGAADLVKMDWVQLGLAPFTESCKALESPITGCILGHMSRDDGSRTPLGSSTQETSLDGFILVKRTDRGSILTVEKSRRAWWIAPGASVELLWRPEKTEFTPNGIWRTIWSHQPPPISTVEQGDAPTGADQNILDVLASSPSPMTAKAIAAEAGVSERHCRRRLNALETAGYVAKNNGRWTLADRDSPPDLFFFPFKRVKGESAMSVRRNLLHLHALRDFGHPRFYVSGHWCPRPQVPLSQAHAISAVNASGCGRGPMSDLLDETPQGADKQ